MKKYFSALLIILLSSFTTAPRIVWLDELDSLTSINLQVKQ